MAAYIMRDHGSVTIREPADAQFWVWCDHQTEEQVSILPRDWYWTFTGP